MDGNKLSLNINDKGSQSNGKYFTDSCSSPDGENLTKKCSVRLFHLDLDVNQILNIMDSEKSLAQDAGPPRDGSISKEQFKRDSDSSHDGPVLKKHKNEDIVLLESDGRPPDKPVSKPPVPDVTVIKVKTGLTPTKDVPSSNGSGSNKERKSSSSSEQNSSEKLKPSSSLQRTSSFDSGSRKSDKEKSSKSSSSSSVSASSASCTLDKTDRTSLNCLEQKLLQLQRANQKSKPSVDNVLSSKPKSSSPLGTKPSKDSHHRRKEDFITDRKKLNSSPSKKLLKKSSSLPAVKDNKMGNLFCPTTDAKVTILPINKPGPKDFDHKPPTTSNSVTITKISSGDSLNVPSREVKKSLSPKSKTSPDSAKNKVSSSKSFSKINEKHKSDKHKDHKLHRDKDHRSSSRESKDGNREHRENSKHNHCSKCNEQFSTKEAKKLHTCNSILDAHYLIDERDRQKNSPTGSMSNDSSGTSLSRSSSRSSSPGIPVAAKKSSSDTPPKLSGNKNDSPDKVKFSFKKDEFDEKVKKQTFGLKRDSPKEKWVESKSSFKSDNHSESKDVEDKANNRTSGITIEPVKLNNELVKQVANKSDDCRSKEDLQCINRTEHDFTFSGKRTYSPSMSENMLVDGKESPRENNSKDSPASQADSGVFSIASSASPSKHDGVLNTDVRSPDSPGSRVPALDNNAAHWAKTSMSGMMPGMSAPSAMPPSYSESCLAHGMAIPNNLSITRLPYPGHPGMNQKPMGGPMGPQPPWMHPSMGPHGPHGGPHGPHPMHPHYQQQQQYSASLMNEMEKKKRGRPRKNQMDGGPGAKSRGGKSKAEDNKDMYDFEDTDDAKAVQPLRPKRQNEGRPPNYKDTDSDEDGKQRQVGQQPPMIHATQGFRQVQENAGVMLPGMNNHCESYGQPQVMQPQQPPVGMVPGMEGQEGQEGDDKNEKSISYTSKIEETPKGGIKLKIKIKKSASPVPPDPEPPLKKPKTDCFDGNISDGLQAPLSGPSSLEDSSIMNTMNEMQRLASSGCISRPSSVPSDYHPSMSPSPLKSPHTSLASPNSPHGMRPAHMMKPGIPGGAETRGVTPPGGQHQGMMRAHGPHSGQQQGGHMPGYPARPPNPHHPAMQNNFQNQGSHNMGMQQHQQHQMSQQQQQQHRPMHPQQQQQHHQGQMQPGNYGDYNNFNNRGYSNFMEQQQQQQQMYNRQQQYDQHMSAYRPGMTQQQQMVGMGGQMRPGYMPQQQMMNTRYPGQQHANMDPAMSRLAPGMGQRMHHPNMMRPMMGGHPGHGYPANSVMPPNISPGSMHPARSPHPQSMAGHQQSMSGHPQTGHPQTMNDGRPMFQGGQYRMGSPQYPQSQQQHNFTPSPTSQGYPPTPGGYQQPLTPGYQKPPTPQSHANPATPQSSHNPLTPGSYPNPSTPGGSYPNPTTPVSYPNPTTPVSYQNPLTPQPPQSPAGQHPQMINNDIKMPTPHQNNFNPPKNESVIQPNIFKDGVKNPMLSPPMSNILTSDLRKIRRPSKSVTPGTLSPNQKTLSPNQIKTEVKPDPDADLIKKEAPSPSPAAAPAPLVKSEPVVPKMEKPESPKPPPPKAKTPEPYIPMEPKWGEEGADGMPERALKRVFQYVCYSQGCLPFLLQAMRICKLWGKVARDQSLWTHANLGNKIKEKSRTEKNLEWILKNKFPNAVEVDVSNWRAAISAPALKIIAAHCPNLTGLGLSQCVKLSHEDVRIIPSLFPNLQKVDVSVVAPTTASSRSAASSSCLSDLITAIGDKLTHFNMSSNKMAGLPFVFKAISQHAKNLIELDVSNISTTSRDTILINIEKIQKGCPKLRKLRTTNTMLALNDASVKEQMTSPGFPFLEELTIGVDQRGYFDGMDDGQIERILKKSDKLKVLDIRGCKGISDSTLVRLPCWDIEYLYVSGCSVTSSSRDGLELLVKKWCRTLIDLDIGNTTDNRTVDWAVMALVENEDVLRLRKLNLFGTGVSLKSLTKLLNACKTLESLNLTSCRALPRGMKRMYHNKEDVDSLTSDIAEGKFDPQDAGSDDDD